VGAARAEQQVQAPTRGGGLGRRELGGAAGLVADGDDRLPRLGGDEQAAAEDERDQDEPAPLEVQVVVGLVELDDRAPPAHARVQLLEDRSGAGERQRAGPAEHVALNDRAQPRPVVGEHRLPVGVKAVGQPIEHLARPQQERVPWGRWVVAIALRDVGADDGEVGSAETLDLGLEAGQRFVGDRRDEVGYESRSAKGVLERAERDAAQHAPGAGDPHGVLDARIGLVEEAQARDELPERADRQPRMRELVVGQLDPDHAARTVARRRPRARAIRQPANRPPRRSA
jgi:hypothetical protein